MRLVPCSLFFDFVTKFTIVGETGSVWKLSEKNVCSHRETATALHLKTTTPPDVTICKIDNRKVHVKLTYWKNG